jgi:hypothetical protein
MVVVTLVSLTYGGKIFCRLKPQPLSNLLREGGLMNVQNVAQVNTTHIGMRRNEVRPRL